MKKIALQVTLVLLVCFVAGGVVYFRIALPEIQRAATIHLVHDVQEAIAVYAVDYGKTPSEPAALVAALKGENLEEKDYLPEIDGEGLDRGVLLDPHGVPLAIRPADPLPLASAAGPDGAHGTADDIASTELREIFARYGIFDQLGKLPTVYNEG